jgi:tetratricopeptide (TPR) repeat protein
MVRLLLLLSALAAFPVFAATADDLVKDGLAAEARLETGAALRLFLEADRLKPNDPFILQKIARQYSDSVVDTRNEAEKKRLAQTALDYSLRAVRLDPTNPENVLSVAVSHGKLAVYSDTRTKIQYSRLIKEEAERALALNPNYDWAHHVLGRWHYEVASLGPTTRFFVRLVYGGLPSASNDAAIVHLEKAVALAPQTLAHHLELGFAYLEAGRDGDARAAFERGLAFPSREKHDEDAKARAQRALSRLASAA